MVYVVLDFPASNTFVDTESVYTLTVVFANHLLQLYFLLVSFKVHRVSQKDVTIAVNWWYDMHYGSNWIYREFCASIARICNDEAGADDEEV